MKKFESFYLSWFQMVTRPPAVMYLSSRSAWLSLKCLPPLAADDDLVGDLHQQGGDADRVVEVGRDVEDHLDRVEEPHDGDLHLARVLQVDGVDVLLSRPKELCIVHSLYSTIVIFGIKF